MFDPSNQPPPDSDFSRSFSSYTATVPPETTAVLRNEGPQAAGGLKHSLNLISLFVRRILDNIDAHA